MIKLNTMYCADCLELMAEIPDKSIDMILCDLPYGHTQSDWDSIIPFDSLWLQYKRIIKDCGAIVLTASQPFTTDLINSARDIFRYELIWIKNRGTGIFSAKTRPMKAHENICVFYKNSPCYNPQMDSGKPYRCKQGKQSKSFGLDTGKTIVTVNKGERYPLSYQFFVSTVGKNVHPTQKPVTLFEYLIETYTNTGDLVLDNCAGSFTTAIACDNLNRNWICIEKEPKYCDIGLQRINENRKRLGLSLLENYTYYSFGTFL